MRLRPDWFQGLLAAALALSMAAAHAQRADTPVNPFGADPAAVAAGRQVFAAGCVACHGPAGAGTERAPALDTGRFKHGSEDFDVLQTIQRGVPGTQMPPFAALKPEQLWQVVSYLRSLPRTAPVAAPATGAAGDAARGEKLFFGDGQCATCHEINGRGAPLAADLSEIGKRPAAVIQAGIAHRPSARPMFFGPPARYVDVTLQDSRAVTGLLKSEDSFSLVLQDLDGNPLLLDRRQIRALSSSPRLLTPAQPPGEAQTADLVAYLTRQTQRSVLAGAALDGGLSYARLAHAQHEPQNWLTYWGSYAGEHFSELTQINRQTVPALQARWAAALPGSSPLETTPLVVDGVMYASGPPGDVYALDARSGLMIWKFHRQQERISPYQINPYNRGVAVLGRRVFFNTLDNDLIALDARSGRVLWQHRVADSLDGYTMTGAPLSLDGKVIVGVSGGEMGVRGFIEAYDAADGHRLWRFDTIPGPGQPGHESWSGDSWKTGSGATWLTGSYDPQLRLLYWAVGNPGPDYDPEKRQGDNLYTCSVLALDPQTGRLVWHYQMSPHDTHDWDATEDYILAEEPIEGKTRQVLLHADRNGFFYTLDRATGRLLSAVPFVRQTWNKGFAPDGRPLVDPGTVASREGRPVFPSVGGTNFQAPSYDRNGHVLFLSFIDSEGRASYQPAEYRRGEQFTGAHFGGGPPPSAPATQGVMALDTLTGKKLWTFPVARGSLTAGVLGTRGGVVFAATAEGNLIALDAAAGTPLWHFQTGGSILASPMSYAVDGTQYIAIAAGNTLYSFALPDTHPGDH